MAAETHFVALWRGINVGRAKRLAMADVRSLLQSLGYSDVRTLLNSGNAVFVGPGRATAGHAKRIQAAVAEQLGVDALVIVKTASAWEKIVQDNPLSALGVDPARVLVALTRDAASLAQLRPLAQQAWGQERLHVGTQAAYLWCAHGILESPVAVALLKGLRDAGTTRNWASVLKIHNLLQEEP